MTSPISVSISSALLNFQRRSGELTLTKDAKGNYNEYLTLDGLVAEVRPLLVECGIAFTQTPGYIEVNGVLETTLTTTLLHPESETSISNTMLLREAKKDPQGQGSAITYARRYQLMAMLGLVADVDDDAKRATRPRETERNPGTITSKQRRELMGTIRELKLATGVAQQIVRDVAGVEKSEDIPAVKLTEVRVALEEAAAA